MLTLLLGGARSGKSSLAVTIGERHRGPVTYLATSPRIDGDRELADRISAHRAERPPHWRTIEQDLDLAGAIPADESFLIIDCLTLWVNNLLHVGRSGDDVETASGEVIDAIGRRRGDTVAVSNEVGLGIVPENELARTYRDVLGRVNQQWAAAADRAFLLVAGRALPLHDPDIPTGPSADPSTGAAAR